MYLTLCNSIDCNMPDFPVHHQFLELTQTHVHQVGDAIQQSHLLSSLSPPTFNLSQHQVFSNKSVLCIRWPKYWSFSFSISLSNEYSGLISLRIDWFDLLEVQFSSVTQLCLTLCNPMDYSTPGFPVHHQLPELIHTLPLSW